MNVKQLFIDQQENQRLLGSCMGKGNAAVKENLTWLVVEIGEVIAELNVKPWKAAAIAHPHRVQEELVDCMQFLINAMLEADMSVSQFKLLWKQAQEKTRGRILSGY